jgi:hypothetical protein
MGIMGQLLSCLPLGWTKTPLSTPALRARLNRESNIESV